MASQMVDYMKRQSNEKGAELIDFKQGVLEYNVKTPKLLQDLSWLTQHSQNHIAIKELPPSPQPKKYKENWSEFEKRIISQRTEEIGFLQKRQMGKASKKDWDLDMPHIRNFFAYLTVWLNPIRIEAKYGK